MKRILTIQDISCLGKCSLTVALPVISAMGVEAVIIPTAVLSTHTMFQNFTYRDLTSDILPVVEHWKKEGITFDAVYTGYLGSIEQVDIMIHIMNTLGAGRIRIVDPAMADNGKLYTGFDMDFVKKCRELCGCSDIAVPNITEASLLTGMEYRETYDEAYIQELLQGMADLGARKVVLTGVSYEEDKIGMAGYDSETGKFFQYFTRRLPVAYHGTGDIYASTLTGALMRGFDTEEAAAIAADFTGETIRLTMENPDRRTYGVDFENALPYLWKLLQKKSEPCTEE